MAERWQTRAAIASAVVAAVALALSWQWNRQNDKVTARQEARLDVQEQRLNRQEVEQYASKVYLGEALQYFYEEFGRPEGGTWVVVNASGTQVNGAWVEGGPDENGQPTAINIDGVQRCTLYSLPPGFRPVALYFTDPYGDWRRRLGAQLEGGYQPMPAEDTGVSPYVMDVEDCSG
jgi:hypothetical protein